MTRDNNEQVTVRDVLDFDNVAPTDDDGHDHCGGPRVVPDHGQQPRLSKRPIEVVYKRDPANMYRPKDKRFIALTASFSETETLGDDRRFDEQRRVARLLAKTARAHAPRLRWRTDTAIAEVIEREVLPDARVVAASLPADIRAKVLDQFLDVLRNEIDLIRKNKRITKT